MPAGDDPDPAAGVAISVIVPTYREGDRVYGNLCHMDAALATSVRNYEIIVVSDGNTDQTAEEIARLAAERPHIHAYHYPRNQGKGYALTHGVAHSRGRLVTFCDGDGDIDPQQIAYYLEVIEREGADIVVGSKRHPESQVIYPGVRRLYSWGYQFLLALLFQLRVHDTQVGLKVFRREVLEAVLPRIVVKRYAFDLELLVVADYFGYRHVVEAPVRIGERFSSTINTRAVANMLMDTAAIFYRKNVLRYYDHAGQTALSDVPLLTLAGVGGRPVGPFVEPEHAG